MNGLAVLATGAGSLAFEVLLVRALAPVLGAAPRTLGAVAAAFLLALALGSLAARGPAGRARRPAIVFAALSAAAGILAALSIVVAPVAASLVALPRVSAALDPFAFAAAFALAFPAAFLMGAAFPFVVAAERSASAAAASRLYGLNTLGGVAGALLTPVLFLPALGVSLSAVAAGGLEAAGGLAAAIGGRARGPRPAAPAADRPPIRVLAAMALVSALALAAEMALARLLALFLRNSVFTVAALLAGYLLGNGFGSFAFASAAARSRDPRRLLGLVLGGAGLAAAAGLHAVFLLARATEAGARASGPGYLGLDGVAAEMAFEISLAAPVAILPAFFFGAAFPCILALAIGKGPDARPGPPVAALVAWSGAGSVAGSVLGAAALVPLLGASRAALAVGALAVLAGAFILARSGARLVAAAGLLLFAAAAIPVGEALRVRGASAPAGAEIVSYEEGPAAAVAVLREPSGALRLEVNGTYSQGGGDGLVLERRQGFLSALLAGGPVRRALVIGVGTGHTLSGLLMAPGVEAVEAVEILPEIAAALPLFAATNRGAAEDARVRLVLDDGRRVARERAGAELDLVVGDLFFPWEAGAGALYAREQFAAVRAALRPGGTFVQWLPLHQLGPDVLASVVATFLDAFPDAALFLGAPGASSPIAALVARRGEGGENGPRPSLSLDRLDAVFASSPALAAELSLHGLVDPFDALALFVAEGEGLARFARGAPINTDDRPFVELRAPAYAAASAGLGLANLEALLSIRSDSPAPLAGGVAPPPGLVRRHAAYGRLASGFLEELRAALDPRARVVPAYAEMYLRKEESEHLAAFEIDPLGGFVRVVATERVLARLRGGAWGEALSLLDRMAEVEPIEPAWRSLAAVALLGLGEPAEAAASVRLALERRPGHAPDHALLGRALAASGDAAGARLAFEEARRIDPANAAAKAGLEALEAGKEGAAEPARDGHPH